MISAHALHEWAWPPARMNVTTFTRSAPNCCIGSTTSISLGIANSQLCSATHWKACFSVGDFQIIFFCLVTVLVSCLKKAILGYLGPNHKILIPTIISSHIDLHIYNMYNCTYACYGPWWDHGIWYSPTIILSAIRSCDYITTKVAQ